MHLPGQSGQMLAQMDSRHRGGDGSENAADLGGRLGFHVPHVQMTGAAIEKNHDAGIRAGGAADRAADRISGQELRQSQSDSTQRPHVEECATAEASAGVQV